MGNQISDNVITGLKQAVTNPEGRGGAVVVVVDGVPQFEERGFG